MPALSILVIAGAPELSNQIQFPLTGDSQKSALTLVPGEPSPDWRELVIHMCTSIHTGKPLTSTK